MDLDFSDAKPALAINDILRKISEYDIFKRYCKNFEEIDVKFCSDLRTDNNPSCKIYITSANRLYYKDYANGDHFSCWHYVMAKYACTLPEAVNIVGNDFNIRCEIITLNPRIIVSNDEFKSNLKLVPRPKSTISIVEQPYTLADYNYWNSYGIGLDLLEEYNVFSAKIVYLIKGDKRYVFEYSNRDPQYAYRFTRDGHYSYKIYRPLGDKKSKWLFNGGASEDIEGHDQLPLSGETLVLTKSLKDCICYRLMGHPAISLQGEANKLDRDLVDKLLKRFDRIIINYDNDEQGIKSTNSLQRQYGFKSFYVDTFKDLSDYIKIEGLDKAKKMINDKITNCL